LNHSQDDPANPWPKLCPGAGNITTSGFEGFWSFDPFKWSNEYFTNLRDGNWELTKSPVGQPQWQAKNNSLPGLSPSALYMLIIET
jgi:catalase (peroxidase I)